MPTNEVVDEAKRVLSALYGPRLHALVMHGSEARGTARPDSDIDLLVVLEPPCAPAAEVGPIVDALYPLVLRSGRRIDAQPVEAGMYEAAEYALYRTAQREGIVL